MIVGQVPCAEGGIGIDDIDLTGEPMQLRALRDLGFLPQDEPFAGVAPISVVDIQQIIRQLCARDIGILIADHNVREALGICRHAYILNEGRIIAAGEPEAILNNQQVRDVYLGREFRL